MLDSQGGDPGWYRGIITSFFSIVQGAAIGVSTLGSCNMSASNLKRSPREDQSRKDQSPSMKTKEDANKKSHKHFQGGTGGIVSQQAEIAQAPVIDFYLQRKPERLILQGPADACPVCASFHLLVIWQRGE